MSTFPAKTFVLGSCPMAMKAASTEMSTSSFEGSRVSWSWMCVSSFCSKLAPSSEAKVRPTKRWICEFHLTWMLGLLSTLFTRTRLARKESRRWMSWTEEQRRESISASSMAVSPPPTTAQALPLYRYPSQAAQLDTPKPLNSHSPETSSHLLSAPVATMIMCALIKPDLLVTISKGVTAVFTDITLSSQTSVKKLLAWVFMIEIIFPPFSRGRPG
mmetsp:Transcript_32057/g.51594  ORF Transcript_32057/g.51594 Transcript_32057/m.51594 type:complete len:216 (-) Transcript_32057:194-841(-)